MCGMMSSSPSLAWLSSHRYGGSSHVWSWWTTNSCAWHDSFVCVPWLIHLFGGWFIHVCSVTLRKEPGHTWTSHGTHVNESCHTYEWVMSNIWMRHVTPMNESCHTYEQERSHIRMSHVKHMNELWHTYEWVMSHLWTSHVTRMNESLHTYE